MNPGLSERQREILRMLSEDRSVSVRRMSEALGVSSVTLRSDLNGLAEQGLILRTRGGAMPAFHPRILEQRKRNVAVKRRIAKRAAALVGDGDSVMIVAGSTASFVGQYLLGKTDVKVVTNSTLLLPYARTNPALQMTLTGGVFVPSAEAMVGPNTLRTLGQFHAKTAFLGTDGFSLKSGITADAVDVAEVVRAMAAQADRAVLLADSSKYGRAGFAHIMGLAEIGVLITDNGLEHSIRRDLEEHGIEVECV